MKFNPLKTLKSAGYFFCVLLGVAIGMTVIPAYRVMTSIFGGRVVQSLTYDGKHHAVLYKRNGLADFNFLVAVDGKTVYESSDLMPFPDGLYRETLVWDKTGRVVVLELMGKRVFAYDAEEQRELKKGELSQYQIYPSRSEYVYTILTDIDDEAIGE